jgi:hypothetical protein
MKFILCFLILTGSCSFKKSNQTLKGHEELYAEPEAPLLQDLLPEEKRIIIAATNDVHGNYNPSQISFSDTHNKEEQSILVGGSNVISRYFNILRNTYKNVVLLDSGDIFSNGSDIDSVQSFYEKNEYDAVTVGLRDFNLKVPAKTGSNTKLFQNFSATSRVPLLLSNLYELKTARLVEWEGTKSHLIKDIDGVKVGLIGLIPDDIVQQTPINNRVGLYVESMLQSTLKHARLLKSLGADLIVVLTHQGIDCHSELSTGSKLPAMKVNFDPKKSGVCDTTNVLGEYLLRLPPELVDVVIGGRTHHKMANMINGTLVMGGFPDGHSFSYAQFVINTKTRKVNRSKTIAHQPVFFCNEFFKDTKDCYTEDKSVDHKRRIPATFLGHEIAPESQVTTYRDVRGKTEISKKLTSFKADLSYIPENSGSTQLIITKLTGKELARVLEEDFNADKQDHWQPSPFLVEADGIRISVSGNDLQLDKTYRILSDLESLQNHKFLVKKITSYDSEALMSESWISLDEDYISSSMAAQSR